MLKAAGAVRASAPERGNKCKFSVYCIDDDALMKKKKKIWDVFEKF